ncbi:unnamed protein product [Rotaria sordida]|uniref:Lipocalin/cytosolic fatty-acid binding domain-containing protein n=1 Tax=Rotaria sordida TaxID=392033 RepID=A0A814SUZ6_9BILA|nr:unnamed protein product [Rotaria sordida]CAF4047452.1 unnamed protein product [Rotaria sordida]
MATNNDIERLKGTWDYINGENFDELLKELEVNQEVRTIAKTIKPRVIIDEKDGKWSLTSEKTYKTTTVQFTPGIEFEDISPDGQQITMIIQFENGKWIQRVRFKNGKEMFVERWINDQDQLEVNMKCGNVKGTQLYKRVV